MELHLKIIGVLLILLSLGHLAFPKYFNWEKELRHLSLINRQMMFVHTFFIAFIVLLMGLMCLFSYEELLTTKLGKTITLGLSAFWMIRLFFQFFVYSIKLWKGKRFETLVHIIFSMLWSYLSVIFIMSAMSNPN